MVTDADSHADEDRKRKEEVEVRNTSDSLIYATEKTLKDLADKVPDDVKAENETALEAARKALEGSDVEAIKSTTEALQAASFKLAEIVYSAAQEAETQQEGGGEPAPAAEDVVDADYEVVDGDES